MSPFIYYLGLGIASYTFLTIILYLLSKIIPIAGFFARLLAAYASLVFCASVGVVSSIILRLAGYQRISQWFVARCFKYTMWYTTGITFIIDDPNDYLNKTRPAIFIGNHQTELDVLMLGCIFPKWCSVTAKKSLKRVPFLGWFMALSGSVFIDRGNSINARQAMSGATDEITRERQSVYMFPEGTRSYARGPKLLPFKKGAFHLAVQAGVPIVPVVVANYSHILSPRTLTFKAGKIPIRVLQPIDTKNLTSADVDDLTRETQAKMLEELIQLTTEAQTQHVSVPI
ncbi:1-acyl-sn-glycerol-3-phosphate acyltransferase [Erysiphe necator]|nr:1-acyl-sn-glycerol-3-phosphate acyltransferase [Erysiphe necator]